ncbi:hypothetical protein MBLNU459_g7499t3 [Dothideomycetes sp. NU459]
MDFWSRLIGGGSPQKQQQSVASTPQQRLQRFRRAYSPILQICSRPQTIASHKPALDQLYSSLQRLNAILREETRTPAPHTCLSFAASAQIFSVIARAASISQHGPIVRETVALFAILIDCEADDFVASSVFAKSLMRFVARVLDSRSPVSMADTEADVVELLFSVVAKIRAQPHVLPVWFTAAAAAAKSAPDDLAAKEKKSFVGTTQKDDFPLCYILIDRIHHDGRTGDFARTGLLYIFEAVTHSSVLEDWIIESDLPTLMASGLGALYSQLSRELSILHDPANLPVMLALSDYAELQRPSTAESIFSDTYAGHMSTFLSHLAFWQDVLEHCKSDNVKQTLLDHFQVLFLQQLLYPSLLQSSDTDGGSSVAVLTYLATILESLDHPDLVQMMLRYLLAMPDTLQVGSPAAARPSLATKRQMSLILLGDRQVDDEALEPTLFSLVDLVLNGIRSTNPQTAIAALKLSSVLLTRHREYAVAALVRARSLSAADESRSAGALGAETETLLQLAASIGQHIDMDDAYATAAQDITAPLEIQLAQPVFDDDPASNHPGPSQRLTLDDPFLTAVIDTLGSFFVNSVDVNLALTESLTNLALCSSIGLEGWLAFPPSSYDFGQDILAELPPDMDAMDEEEASALQKLYLMQRRPGWKLDQAPVLRSLLQSLESQVDAMRLTVTNIDELVSKRMEIFGGIDKEHISPALSHISPDHEWSDRAKLSGMGQPRTLQQLRSEPPAQVNSRSSSASPSRLSTPQARDLVESPLRTREGSLKVTSRSSSLPKSTPVRTAQTIFQPPPPESSEGQTPSHRPATDLTPERRRENESETLRRRLRFHRSSSQTGTVVFEYAPGDVENNKHNNADNDNSEPELVVKEVSLSHVLTNIVVLHHFVLELAAVMQTRATLFKEVAFVERQAAKWKDHGVFIAIANITAFMQFGEADNPLVQSFTKPSDRMPKQFKIKAEAGLCEEASLPGNMFFHTLTVVLWRKGDYNVLPHVHVILIFIRSVCLLETTALADKVLQLFPWRDLAAFLNSFAERESISNEQQNYSEMPQDLSRETNAGLVEGVEAAKDSKPSAIENVANDGELVRMGEGRVASSPKPLPEDYLMQGMVWCETYFTQGWFANEHDEESRLVEFDETDKIRATRVFLLSIELSKRLAYFDFDDGKKTFSSSSETKYVLPDRKQYRSLLESTPGGTLPERSWISPSKAEEVFHPLTLDPDMGLRESVVSIKRNHEVQIADQDEPPYSVF